jgi:putative hydrolase
VLNRQLAEYLARHSETREGDAAKALRRASRLALEWPEEVEELLARGTPLTSLIGVGPYTAQVIGGWLEDPPEPAEPPPLRADFQSLAGARKVLAARERPLQLRGDLQMHSDWSDGVGSIAELADAATQLGHEYIAITDHSQGLKIAGGIDEDQLLEQRREIDAVNAAQQVRDGGARVLQALEMNISPTGDGDTDPAALAQLDLVLGSFHSQLRRKEDQTERYLAALRNPDIQVLGHPRGRIYNFRLGLWCDWDQVFAVAKQLDKAVEVDCFPDRQDLNVELLERAASAGCLVSVGTDSHYPRQLGWIDIGASAITLAGIPDDRVINTWPLQRLREWRRSL